MASNLVPENFEFKRDALAHIDRCFVLGNGPTLNKYNLEALNNELTFGCNYIMNTGFTPDFLCISDPGAIKEGSFPNMQNRDIRLILSRNLSDNFVRLFGQPRYNIKCVDTKFDRNVYEHNELWFGDFDKIHSTFSVLGDFALTAPIYLGIKNIYILGLDYWWNYPYNNQMRHAYDEPGKAPEWCDAAIGAKEIFMTISSRIELLATKIGTKIYNASPGSPFVCFQKLEEKYLPQEILYSYSTYDALGKYLLIYDRLYKIIPSVNGDHQACSLIDIESGKLISWLSGPWYNPAKFITIDPITAAYSLPLRKNCSFVLETGFTDRNKISIATIDKHYYIVKHPYYDRLFMQPFNREFDPRLSSYIIFNDLNSALSNIGLSINSKNAQYINLVGNMAEGIVNNSRIYISHAINNRENTGYYITTYHGTFLSYNDSKRLYNGTQPNNFISYTIDKDKITLIYGNKYLNYISDKNEFVLGDDQQPFDIVRHSKNDISIKIADRYLTAMRGGGMNAAPHILPWEHFYIRSD